MNVAGKAFHGHCVAQASVDTPLGPMLLARSRHGLIGAWFEAQKHHPGRFTAPVLPGDELLRAAALQLQRYFSVDMAADSTADPLAFTLPLDLQGTPFQLSVWQALLHIPRGSVCSYADIAARLGRPKSVRAVGAAVGRNPVSVIVPCHRVVGSNGALTGYAGGVERKLALLQLEAVMSLSLDR